MDPDHYCQARVEAIVPLRYCLRLAPATLRSALFAFHAYQIDLAEALAGCHSPEAFAAQLDWWRGETAAAAAGSGRHPSVQAAWAALRRHELPARALDPLLGAVAGAVAGPPPDTVAELVQQEEGIAGHTWALCAGLLAGTDPERRIPETVGHRIGAAAGVLGMLARTGVDAARGRVCLPPEALRQSGVALPDLRAGRGSPALATLIHETARTVVARQDQALAALPAGLRLRLRPLIAFAGVNVLLAQDLQRHGDRVLREELVISPLRLWWAVVRAR